MNFRGEANRIYTFEIGVNLIEGLSGSGKSTIFTAIAWAFYGAIQKIGSKDNNDPTEVKVSWKGFSLHRRNRSPAFFRVKVKKREYLGEDAKAYIHQRFGSYDTWLACSYMRQAESSHFFNTDNNTRRDIINTLIYGQDDPEKFVAKLDASVKKLQKECDQQTVRIQTLKEELPEKVPETRPSVDIEKEIKRLKRQREKHETAYREYCQAETLYAAQCAERTEIQAQIQTLRTPIETCSYLDILRKLPDAETDDSQLPEDLDAVLLQWKEFEQQQKHAAKIRVEYSASIPAQQQEVRAWQVAQQTLKIQLENYQRAQTLLRQHKELLAKRTQYEARVPPVVIPTPETINPAQALTADIAQLEAQVHRLRSEIKLCEHSLQCPNCEQMLLLYDGKLTAQEVSTSTLKAELEEYEDKLRATKNRRNELDFQYKEQKRAYQNYLQQQAEFDDIQQKLLKVRQSLQENPAPTIPENPGTSKACPYPLGILELRYVSPPEYPRKQCEAVQALRLRQVQRNKLLAKLPPNPMTLSEAEASETQELQRKTQYSQLQNRLAKLTLAEPIKVSPPEDLSERIEGLEQNLQHALKYERYRDAYLRYRKVQKAYKELHLKLQNHSELQQYTLKFYQSRLEPTLLNINTLTDDFLRTLFALPIEFRLSSYREGQQFRQRFNFNITYKNTEYSISELSGGERMRVSIALTFALFYHRDQPFIIFDESLASLDAETSKTIIEFIQQYFPDKIVLIAAHNVVHGNFDHVVQIDGNTSSN